MEDIGGHKGGINAYTMNQCPFNLPSEKWKYADNGWIRAGANEINIYCIHGNLINIYTLISVCMFPGNQGVISETTHFSQKS